MIRFDIISAVPALLESPLAHSIVGRAQKKGLAEIVIHNLRDYAVNKHGQIDDTCYGGGAGMVLMIEPVDKLLQQLRSERNYDEVIYMCPDGEIISQSMCNRYALSSNIAILCGHYKGIDERIREHLITKEVSLGDFVLSGGELPAAVFVDAVVRLIPGVLNDETSALTDSFQAGLVDAPVYTKPVSYNDWKVPDILLSGDHARIEDWRLEQALQRTKARRPGLFEKNQE